MTSEPEYQLVLCCSGYEPWLRDCEEVFYMSCYIWLRFIGAFYLHMCFVKDGSLRHPFLFHSEMALDFAICGMAAANKYKARYKK